MDNIVVSKANIQTGFSPVLIPALAQEISPLLMLSMLCLSVSCANLITVKTPSEANNLGQGRMGIYKDPTFIKHSYYYIFWKEIKIGKSWLKNWAKMMSTGHSFN